MTRAWRASFTRPSDSTIDAYVAETMGSLPHIATRQAGEDVQDDVLEAWRRYAYLYYDTLATLKLPSGDDVAEFEKVARRRLHQSVELVDLHAAFRSGARILLEHALTLVDPVDGGMVASLTLEFEDLMATAAERAYLEEQRSMSATANDYTVRLLLRLLRGEIRPDDVEVSMAPVQGYDFSRTFTMVSLARSGIPSLRRTTDGSIMARLGTSLRSVLPFALQVPYDDTLYLLVPGDAVSSLSKLLTRVLESSVGSAVKGGISTPTAGLGGAVSSARRATRARLVGEILEPTGMVHTWERMRTIDVFGGSDAVAAYVEEQLGALLENDERKGTQLVETLAAFLEANGNRKSAARDLTVHINTLDYRLRQIRKILGHDSLAETSFSAHLAVRLFPLYLMDREGSEGLSRGTAGEATTAVNGSTL